MLTFLSAFSWPAGPEGALVSFRIARDIRMPGAARCAHRMLCAWRTTTAWRLWPRPQASTGASSSKPRIRPPHVSRIDTDTDTGQHPHASRTDTRLKSQHGAPQDSTRPRAKTRGAPRGWSFGALVVASVSATPACTCAATCGSESLPRLGPACSLFSPPSQLWLSRASPEARCVSGLWALVRVQTGEPPRRLASGGARWKTRSGGALRAVTRFAGSGGALGCARR